MKKNAMGCTLKRWVSCFLFRRDTSDLGIHIHILYMHMCIYMYVYAYKVYVCMYKSISFYLNIFMYTFVCVSWNANSNTFQVSKWIFIRSNTFIIN